MIFDKFLKNKFIISILISIAILPIALAQDRNLECERLRVKSTQIDTQTFYPIKSFGKWYAYVSSKACWTTTLSIKPVTDSIHSNNSCFSPSAFSIAYFRDRDAFEAPQISIVTDFSLTDKYIQLYLNKTNHFSFFSKKNTAWPHKNNDHVILERIFATPVFNLFYSSQSEPKKIRMESFSTHGFRRALRTVEMRCPFLGLTTQRKASEALKTAFLNNP